MPLTQRHRPAHGLIPVVLFTAFLAAFNIGVMNPILPSIVGQYGGTTLEVGLLFSTLYCANFFASPIWGLSSDRVGRRPILLLSLIGVSSGYLLFSVGGALWVLFAACLVVGISDGSLGAIYAYAADTTDLQNRTRTFSFISAAMSVGFIVGPLVSGQLFRLHPAAPIWVIVAALLLNAIWVFVAMPETNTMRHHSTSVGQRSWNPILQLTQTLKLPQLRWLLASFFLMITTTVITWSHLPAVGREVLGWTPQQLAIPFAVYGIVDFIGQAVILPVLLPKLGEVRLAIVGSLLLAITFALFGTFLITGVGAILYLAIVINGIGQPFSESSLNGLMSKSVEPKIQGQIQGGIRAAFALGRIIGPLCAGSLGQAISPSTPYWLGSGQMLIAGAAIFLAIPALQVAEQKLHPSKTKTESAC
jgi:DHA1 family tetracycline resistance protein-like MFS transporter